MAVERIDPEVAYERLGQYLKALGNPLRLELLYKLRLPKRASEVAVAPRRADARYNPDRTISRQAVLEHLEVLEAIGVVSRQATEGDGADEFVTNHQRLFAIVEEMRKLTQIRPAAAFATQETMDAPDATPAEWPRGPKLVIVSGSWEGRVFPLAGAKEAWTLGRGEGADVRIDYDPYISAENARLRRGEKGFEVQTLPDARNGTTLNFRPLAPGTWTRLDAGDIVGAGRSLLVYRVE